MTAPREPLAVVREAVAAFPDRARFHHAVRELREAGFAETDLSVLATHQPLADAAGDEPALPAGLIGEIKYVAPLTAAGIIFVSSGPIAAIIAGLVGAGLGAAALKELFDDYTATPQRSAVAAAFDAGAALLWVRCADPELELTAARILEAAGGQHVHIHGRAEAPPAA